VTDPLTTLPADFGPLRDAAIVAAEEHHTALVAAMAKRDGSVSFGIGAPEALVLASLSLLADLTRPESRLHWVFWLQQQQAEPGGGQVWWDVVSDADEAKALRAAVLAVGGGQ